MSRCDVVLLLKALAPSEKRWSTLGPLTRPGSLGRISVFAFAVALVFLAPKPAFAVAKRFAIMPIEGIGKKEASIAGKLAGVLKQHKVQVAPVGTLKKALRKQGAPSSEADWVKLARKLKVDGFVESTLSHAGGKRALEVRIRNGADGSVAGQETFTVKGPAKRLAAVIGISFWKKLGSAIRQTSVPTKGESGGLPVHDLPAPTASEPSTAARSETKAEAKNEIKNEAKTETKTGIEEAPPSGGLSSGKPTVEPEPAEKPTPSAEGEHEEPEDKASERASTATAPAAIGGLPTVEIEADLRALRRVFEYVPVSAGRSYVLNFYTPVIAGRAAWFPIKYLGVFAMGEASLALETGQYPTATQEIMLGAQFRMPFSFGQIGATAAYFRHNFLIRDTPDPNDASRLELQVPNTAYVGGRFGANARFRIGSRMQAGVDVGYRLVTSAGQDIGQVRSVQYFPASASPIAVDAGAFLGYRIGTLLEARAGLDYRRYAFGKLQSGPESLSVIDATGGLDQYVALFLGIAGVFGVK
jgi:hypothetical protein